MPNSIATTRRRDRGPWVAAGTGVPLPGATWIALRRVSEGLVGRVGGWWFDGGRRVPCYVAEALPGLCKAGLVSLADPDPTAMARAALTAAGADRFEQLCQQRNQALQARASQLAATWRTRAAADQIGVLIAVCRLLALGCVHTGTQPTVRSCPRFQATPAAVPVSAPRCPDLPDSGRPLVEQPPRQIPAPGGRPDTTVAMQPATDVAVGGRGEGVY